MSAYPMTPLAWIAVLKAQTGWSYYRIARELEISEDRLRVLRHKGGAISDETAGRLFDKLDLPPELATLFWSDMRFVGAKDPRAVGAWKSVRDLIVDEGLSDEARAYLEKVAKSVAAVVLAVLVALGLGAPAPAQAANSALYIMSNAVRRWRVDILDRIARSFRSPDVAM